MHLVGQYRPAEFLRWAKPRFAVISGRRGVNEEAGMDVASKEQATTKVLHTGIHGAIRYTIEQDGTTTIKRYRDTPW